MIDELVYTMVARKQAGPSAFRIIHCGLVRMAPFRTSANPKSAGLASWRGIRSFRWIGKSCLKLLQHYEEPNATLLMSFFSCTRLESLVHPRNCPGRASKRCSEPRQRHRLLTWTLMTQDKDSGRSDAT